MTRQIFLSAFLLAMPTLAMAERPGHDSSHFDRTELMEQIKEKYPEKWEYLKKLRHEDPRKFHAAMKKLRRHMMMGSDDPEVQTRMKAMRELGERFKKAVSAYREASADEKKSLRKELLEMASEMFDAKQAIRKRKLERAKKRIEDLEEEIGEREKKRDDLIEEFVDEATGDELQGL